MSMVLLQKQMLLLLANHRKISIVDLEQELAVSKKNIQLTKEYLSENYADILSIKAQNQHFSLEILNSSAFYDLLAGNLLGTENFNSFHKRQAYILNRLAYHVDFLSAEEIADEVQISRRTLSRDLLKIDETLKKYQIKLVTKRGVGIKMVGLEESVRLLLLYEVMDWYDISEELPLSILAFIQRVVDEYYVPPRIEQILRKTIKLTILRVPFSFSDKAFDLFYDAFADDEYVLALNQAIGSHLNRELIAQEKIFLSFPLSLGLCSGRVENQCLMKLSKEMLDTVKSGFSLSFDTEEMSERLNSHLTYMINRSVMGYVSQDVILRKGLLKSSFALTIADYFIREVKINLGVEPHESEIQILSAWFELLIVRGSNHQLIRKVAVITKAGYSFCELLRQELQVFFHSDLEIQFFTHNPYSSYEELSKDYDLIFTDDWAYSREKLANFFPLSIITRGNTCDKLQMELSVLSNQIRENCNVFTIDFGLEDESYETYLVRLTEELIEEGLVNKIWQGNLLAKESKNPSISATGLAFPHIVIDSIEKILLGFVDNEKVSFNSKNQIPVTDFIFIGVPEVLSVSQESLLIKIFDSVFSAHEESTVKTRLGINDVMENQS